MPEKDSSTPRLDALRLRRFGSSARGAEERTRNQVASAADVLGRGAKREDDLEATMVAPVVTEDEADDDLPGSPYAGPLGSTAASRPRVPSQHDEVAMPDDSDADAHRASADEDVVTAGRDADEVETAADGHVEEPAEVVEAETTPAPMAAPLFRDPAPARTSGATAAAPASESANTEQLDAVEATTVIPVDERDREAEREARAKRLGIVAAAPPATEPVVPVARARRTTDKWHGSLALLLLRLVTSALLFTQGFAHVTHWSQTKEFFARSILPQPEYFAIGVVAAELLAALLLLVGLGVRFAGLLLLAIQVIMLVFFVYGKSGAIYTPGEPGFKGDVGILLAAIGLLFLLLGGGGVAIDRVIRRNRARAKEEKLLGNRV